jgi:hypothetical protein
MTLANPVTASDTTITVADATAFQTDPRSPSRSVATLKFWTGTASETVTSAP